MGNKVVKSKTLSNDRGRLSETQEMDGYGNAFFLKHSIAPGIL